MTKDEKEEALAELQMRLDEVKGRIERGNLPGALSDLSHALRIVATIRKDLEGLEMEMGAST